MSDAHIPRKRRGGGKSGTASPLLFNELSSGTPGTDASAPHPDADSSAESKETPPAALAPRKRRGGRSGKEARLPLDGLSGGAPDDPGMDSPRPAAARFHLESLLGAGGMCEVYAALDLRRVEWGDAAPRVALKRLLPELADDRQAQAALAQEFFILRRLIHPGVVRVYDLHQEPWGLCYSMEMLEGANMAALPQGMGREARKVAACLFKVLAFLHGRGITHGDIKPSNVFLAPDGRVALIDFTTARVTLRPGQTSVSLALGPRARQHFGACSPLHASPERLESGEPSTADDVFAACCTVHEMLCGTHPFQRLPSREAAALRLRPSRPAGITVIQWLGLRQGLAFNPAHRPDAARLAALFQGRAILPLPLSRLRWAALRSP